MRFCGAAREILRCAREASRASGVTIK